MALSGSTVASTPVYNTGNRGSSPLLKASFHNSNQLRMRIIKILISIILFGLLAFPLFSQEPVPFAGESVWNTNCAKIPGVSTEIYTVPVVDSLGQKTGKFKTVKHQLDVVDSIEYKLQWIITDKVIQRSTEGLFIWEIKSAAIASDGQCSSYEISLLRTIDFSRATMANHGAKSKAPPPSPARKATLVVLCPQGQFTEILLIEQNNIVTYQ